MRRLMSVLMTAVAVATLVPAMRGDQVPQAAASGTRDAVRLEQAITREVMDGDLKGAMETYRALSSSPDRAVAAQALLRLGNVVGKLGGTQAVKRVQSIWTGPDVSQAGQASADGRYVPYIDGSDLAVRDLSAGTNVKLTNRQSGESAEAAVASRDGKWMAYTWWFNGGNTSEVRVIDRMAPSSPRSFRIPDSGYSQVMDWAPGGDWLAVQAKRRDGGSQIGILTIKDGVFRPLKSLEWRGTTGLSVSPDGAYLAYDLPAGAQTRMRDVFVIRRDGSGTEQKLTERPGRNGVVGWTPDGRSVLFTTERSGTVGLAAVPVANGAPQGSSRVIEADLGTFSASLGISSTGRLLFQKSVSGRNVFTAEMDFAAGTAPIKTEEITDGVAMSHAGVMWSPDGKSLAYTANGRGGMLFVIRSLETGRTRELIPEANPVLFPSWSAPAFITFQGSDLKGRQGIFRLDVQTGETTLLVGGDGGGYRSWADVTPDGRTLVYTKSAGGAFTLVARDLTTDQERVLVPASGENPIGTQVSPDGRLVAYRHFTAQGQTIMIVPLTGGTPRPILTAKQGLGALVEWMDDGRRLLVRKSDRPERDQLLILDPDRGAVGEVPVPANFMGVFFRVHPDSRRVAYVAGDWKFELWSLENFLPAPPGIR